MIRSRCLTSAAVFAAMFPTLTLAAADEAGRTQSADAARPAPDVVTPHEPRAHDPWMPWRPLDAVLPAPAGGMLRAFNIVQVNVDGDGKNISGDAANEPSIVVDPTDPNRVVIGWRQFDTVRSNFRQAGWGYSHDAGRTWTFPGVLEKDVFRSDPVLAANADGVFYYYSIRCARFGCGDIFKSTDGGVTWGPKVFAFGGDKVWMAIDRTQGIGRGNIYCQWGGLFIRSTDGGETFSEPMSVPGRPLWGTLSVGPQGAVYVVGRPLTDSVPIAKSVNAQDPDATPEFDPVTFVNLGGGLSAFTGPNPAGLLGQIWVDVDHSDGPTRGNVYMLGSVNPPGSDPDDVMFVRSTDGGETWSAPVRVNDDARETNAWQWFGTMSVAPNGRIDAVWYDTRNSGKVNISELFYSFSENAGETWSDNVVLSPPFDSWVGWPRQNKLGDYIHMLSDDVGANLAFAATFNNEQDVYFLRIGDFDCNGNGVGDAEDIANGDSRDCNDNGIPDECELLPAPCDANCDGSVNLVDVEPFIALLLGAEGCAACVGDVNGDGSVDLQDVEPFIECLLGG